MAKYQSSLNTSMCTPMRRLSLRWMLVSLGLLVSVNVQAQGVLVPSQVPPPGKEDSFTLAARNVGIKRCQPALTRLALVGIQGSRNNDLLLDWDRKRPDLGPVFALVGAQYANGGVAISLSAIPDADGGCSVSAERISVAPFACTSIALEELKGYRVTTLLPGFNVYVGDDDPGSSVSLIDSPPGCIVIRRYVQFSWKVPGVTGLPASNSGVR